MSAMSGFGKSTLVAEWAGERDDVAWVGVDGLDSDPSVFWAHLLAAVGQVDDEVGAEATELLAERGAADRMFVVALLSSLEHRATPITIVLDGLDGHLPARTSTAWIAGRAIRRWSASGDHDAVRSAAAAGRWRSRGLITEIREDEPDSPPTRPHSSLTVTLSPSIRTNSPTSVRPRRWPLALSLALSSGWRPSADPPRRSPTSRSLRSSPRTSSRGWTTTNVLVVLAAALLEQPEPEIMMRIVEPELAPGLRRLTSRHPLVAVADPRRGRCNPDRRSAGCSRPNLNGPIPSDATSCTVGPLARQEQAISERPTDTWW
ncbi:MAG: hypothetical protein R2697_15590 [Ilumatobacteraceae bacterium]